MEDLKKALKAAGWTDDIIDHFTKPSFMPVDTIITTNLQTDYLNNQMDIINDPPKIGSTTLFAGNIL